MSDMWNSVAHGWESNAEFVDSHLAQATAAMLDAAGIGRGVAVLDVAAGAGGAGLAAAARVGNTGRVVLADVASAMVAAAARRAGSIPQVSTLECDEVSIPEPDASFDAVICRHGLMFVDPPADAVREAVRVLRPEGRYVAMTWAARAANPWLGLMFDAVGEQFGVAFPPPGVQGPFALDTAELLGAALRAGGLEDVEVQELAAPWGDVSLAAWLERVPQLAGPLAIALAGMEDEVREAIQRRALDKGAEVARLTGSGVVFDGAVLVGSGRRP